MGNDTTEPELEKTQVPLGADSNVRLRIQAARAEAAFSAGETGRYRTLSTLGRGGMGEVELVEDTRIGREVARKSLRAEWAKDEAALPRFLREIRVQGQLEHPAVVPVYDLEYGEDGAPFFTMKRVRGETLADALRQLASGSPAAQKRFTRHRLLSAFNSVCLAIDFAHRRGVVHRDLKPANIMLGEFGEVHVLDWGIAHIADGTVPGSGRPRVRNADPGLTEAGAVMGTIGYMAPEHYLDGVADAAPTSDVFALGSVLFEILTLESLFQGNENERMTASVKPIDFGERLSGVAPELASIVAKAVAFKAHERFATAGQLAEAVEHFLDGDRDLERRREIAAVHLKRAQVRAESSRAHDRVAAIREVFQALSLDPTNEAAAPLLVSCLAEAPADLSQKAQAELRDLQSQDLRASGRLALVRYGTWAVFVPALLLLGPNSWPLALLFVGALGLTLACSAWAARSAQPEGAHFITLLAVSSLVVAAAAGIFGPFILAPALAATNAMFFASHGDERSRRWSIPLGLAAIGVPALLDLTGVLAPAYRFEAGLIQVLPRLTHFPPGLTHGVLFAASLALVLTPAAIAARLATRLRKAESRLFGQAWLLRQLFTGSSTDTRTR